MKYLETGSARCELKAEVPKYDQIVKTLVGFCNQNGGKVVLGVADDSTIVGLTEQTVEDLRESLDQTIFQSCAPPIIPRIYTQSIGEKTVLIIEVSAGMNPPYYRISEGIDRGTYIRLGRSTLRAGADIIHELRLRSSGRSYDATPVYQAQETELDHNRILSFLKVRPHDGEPHLSEETLQAYQLIVEEHAKRYPSVAGILLFGSKPQVYFSEAMIICTHFKGTSGRDVIATRDATGTLFEQVETAIDFVLSRLNRSFKISGTRREEKWEIPPKAIREMIINAVVHRNYHMASPSKIAIYEDRIEIFSPGHFPGPLDEQQLLLGLSFIRNRAIAKVFREAGYIEKLGSGFITLFESFQKASLEKPRVLEGPNSIKVILPRREALKTENDGILLLLTAASEVSVKDVIENLHISRSTASRRIQELLAKGLIKKTGRGPATRYSRV